MGQIKNIKLHIVTDIKFSQMFGKIKVKTLLKPNVKGDKMTGTLREDGFKLTEVTSSVKEETVTVSEFEAHHAFDLLMSDVDGYSPPEVKSTLQDKLQEISMLNDEVTLEEALVTPLLVSGIEANDA